MQQGGKQDRKVLKAKIWASDIDRQARTPRSASNILNPAAPVTSGGARCQLTTDSRGGLLYGQVTGTLKGVLRCHVHESLHDESSNTLSAVYASCLPFSRSQLVVSEWSLVYFQKVKKKTLQSLSY